LAISGFLPPRPLDEPQIYSATEGETPLRRLPGTTSPRQIEPRDRPAPSRDGSARREHRGKVVQM